MHPSSATGEETPGASATALPRAAWIVWGLAAACYLLAIFHRMALGVAALDAEGRLHVGSGAIAALSVAGLTAYLAFQVPAGLVSDRIGPRRGLAVGLAIIATGEALFATSTTVAPSIVGRALVGAGDAFIFLNVLRIVAHWFPRERFAQMTAATATIGALGQVVGTVPLSRSLDGLGWETTFWASAIATFVLAVAAWFFLRERPAGQVAPPRHEHPPVWQSIRRSWARPTTRDGFWAHFTTMAPFVVITGLWGAPILVDAQGMSRGAASTVLLIAVIASAAAALSLGLYVRHHPAVRQAAVMRIGLAVVVALIVLTVIPAASIPPALTVVCFVVIAVGMGAGMLGFDLARRTDDGHDGASTSALVNLGGFSAAIAGDLLVAAARSAFGVSSGAVLLPTLLIAAFGLWRLSRRAGFERRSRGWSAVAAERLAAERGAA
jgi:MFS family permease